MSSAAEQDRRKKLIVYSAFGVLLLVFCVYAYEALFSSDAPAPTQAPVIVNKSTGTAATGAAATGKSQNSNAAQGTGQGAAPGVAATKMASTSSSLDPTLDESAMLRTENLVYSGNGRNIFSATAYVAPVVLPKNVPPPRPVEMPSVPMGPPPPPPPPPIDIKYFGTELTSNGKRQAFLLHGEDVYMASEGDIVARQYKVVSISATTVKIEDLSNSNVETKSLQAN